MKKQEITITPNQNEFEKQFEYANSLIEQHKVNVNAETLLTN